jgi:TolB protein
MATRAVASVVMFLLCPCIAYSQTPQILFLNRPSGTDHLYVMNAGGTNVRQLTTSQDDASESSWSHNGNMVAFSSGGVIYRINADGTNLVQLSPPATQYSADYVPDWSPDDSEIVFANDQTDSSQSHLWSYITVMSAVNGSGRKPIIGNNSSMFFYPHFSPTNPQLLLLASDLNSPGNGQLFTYNAATTVFTQITHINGAIDEPFWSPNGKLIVAQCALANVLNGSINVCVLNANGSNVHEITSFVEPIDIGDPAWSPDGSSITFELENCTGFSDCEGQTNPYAPAAVWTMNANGSNQRSTGQACSAMGCSPRYRP